MPAADVRHMAHVDVPSTPWAALLAPGSSGTAIAVRRRRVAARPLTIDIVAREVALAAVAVTAYLGLTELLGGVRLDLGSASPTQLSGWALVTAAVGWLLRSHPRTYGRTRAAVLVAAALDLALAAAAAPRPSLLAGAAALVTLGAVGTSRHPAARSLGWAAVVLIAIAVLLTGATAVAVALGLATALAGRAAVHVVQRLLPQQQPSPYAEARVPLPRHASR